MTTIAASKIEKTIAGDLQFTEGTQKWKGKTKIYKFKAHELTYPHCDFLAGFCGKASALVAVAEFFSRPEDTKPPKVSGLSGLVLTENGDIFVFDDYKCWIAVGQDYASIGSGSSVALGALASGASVKEAIRAASKYDTYTGMGVKELKF